MLPGIDVSEYQQTTPRLDGLTFAWAKASEGLRRDPMYATHAANIRAAGIPLGAYHFARNDVSVLSQANTFLQIARDADFLAVDIEGPHAFSQAQAKQFVAVIRAANRRIGLYHSDSGYIYAGQNYSWVANYSKRPTRPFLFWQYGPRLIDGKKIDGDWFNGTQADLDRIAGEKATPPPSGNPYQPGTIEYVQWMHDHGYSMAGGKWVQTGSPPPPAPPPVSPVIHPPIPTTPTTVAANVSGYTGSVPSSMLMGGQPALRYGSAGPAFVLVHGGPGGNVGMLGELGGRIASRGGQAVCIHYRDDTWANYLADVEAATDDAVRLLGTVTVVGHSFGGLGASVAALSGHGSAYVCINAVSSLAGTSVAGAPDPIVLAANRPTMPVSVILGSFMATPPNDDKQGFVDALHAAGHPGFYTLGPGDHTGTLYTDATLDTLFATAGLI